MYSFFLVFFYIDKNKKSDRQDKLPVTTYCSSIVSYGISIRSSTSEYFPIKGCSLHLYDRVIQYNDTRADMSEIPSMYCHLEYNIKVDVFNVHENMSIDTTLYTCEIRMYDIKKSRNVP